MDMLEDSESETFSEVSAVLLKSRSCTLPRFTLTGDSGNLSGASDALSDRPSAHDVAVGN